MKTNSYINVTKIILSGPRIGGGVQHNIKDYAKWLLFIIKKDIKRS